MPDYAAIITFPNLGLAFVMVVDHCGDLELRRRAQGAEDRTLRHLSGMSMAKIAIQAVGLNKWFGEGEARTNAVKEVSFDAHFGEMLYVVGPSGSGKTTMLSMISGILRPNGGTVKIEEQDIWSRCRTTRSRTSAAQDRLRVPGLSPVSALTTVENVAIPLILQKRDWDEALKEAALNLEIVGLKARAELPPVKLSGGEQQRVAIARAIVSRPDILIFDEPTASLDGDTGRNIVRFVREHILSDKRCIIIVTHDSRIYEFADRIVDGGRQNHRFDKENLDAQ
jgi:putative ABC transport system ATP-binding protein